MSGQDGKIYFRRTLDFLPVIVVIVLLLLLVILAWDGRSCAAELTRLSAKFWPIILVLGLLAILLESHFASQKKIENEVEAFLKSGSPSFVKVNIMCFISLFVWDWLYAWAFKYVGKIRFIYPLILTLIGGVIVALFSTGDDDPIQFAGSFLLPQYLLIHCLGWSHINLVFRRIQRQLTAR